MPIGTLMAARLAALTPRMLLIGVFAVLCTGTFGYAAEQTLTTTPAAAGTTQPAGPAVLTVPDVVGQAFVFAKGALADPGFAWRVTGSVHGYSANVVATQTPAGGTRVVDTGAPVVTLTLRKNRGYGQRGAPEDSSPYTGTAIKLASSIPAVQPAATTAAAPAPAPAATTATPAPAQTTPSAPAAQKKPSAAAKYPQHRPAAFSVAGAPKEPLNEMPLPDRARALGTWLEAHPKPTNAVVRHWLYQNEWIVTGARFGWWRGAEALRTLIQVDARAESLWGIGSKSANHARAALSEVQARSK
jgi:hypothetical protein